MKLSTGFPGLAAGFSRGFQCMKTVLKHAHNAFLHEIQPYHHHQAFDFLLILRALEAGKSAGRRIRNRSPSNLWQRNSACAIRSDLERETRARRSSNAATEAASSEAGLPAACRRHRRPRDAASSRFPKSDGQRRELVLPTRHRFEGHAPDAPDASQGSALCPRAARPECGCPGANMSQAGHRGDDRGLRNPARFHNGPPLHNKLHNKKPGHGRACAASIPCST